MGVRQAEYGFLSVGGSDMDRKRVAKELVAAARELTAYPKFTAKVSKANIGGNKKFIELFMVNPYTSFDKSGFVSEYNRVRKMADDLMKSVQEELGSKGYKIQLMALRVDVKPVEWELTVFLFDDVSTPENIVWAFEKDVYIKKAWID